MRLATSDSSRRSCFWKTSRFRFAERKSTRFSGRSMLVSTVSASSGALGLISMSSWACSRRRATEASNFFPLPRFSLIVLTLAR